METGDNSRVMSDLMRRVAEMAEDRVSGATFILQAAVAVLGQALDQPAELAPLARALCVAQPTMAPIWNAALIALASRDDRARFTQFVRRVERAPQALARFAAAAFDTGAPLSPRRIVTISSSRSVVTVLEALRKQGPVEIACSESRPALEGRGLASSLAALGVAVTYFSDAALGAALAGAEAVLVGADAVMPRGFLNKVGTRMLAAAAASAGVPVYVAATRDKFVSAAIADRLTIREGSPGEIWDAPPAGVTVRNPYFELTPLDAVTAIISDVGVLGAGMVADVCGALDDEAMRRALAELDSK